MAGFAGQGFLDNQCQCWSVEGKEVLEHIPWKFDKTIVQYLYKQVYPNKARGSGEVVKQTSDFIIKLSTDWVQPLLLGLG